jgi:hypothetical protein
MIFLKLRADVAARAGDRRKAVEGFTEQAREVWDCTYQGEPCHAEKIGELEQKMVVAAEVHGEAIYADKLMALMDEFATPATDFLSKPFRPIRATIISARRPRDLASESMISRANGEGRQSTQTSGRRSEAS